MPPLRALTAFEAAARLGSFRKAADELGITRSAISHQIKALEDILGVDLFSRDGKRAELTGPGQIYYPAVREAFDQIESQTQVIRPRAQHGIEAEAVLRCLDLPRVGPAHRGQHVGVQQAGLEEAHLVRRQVLDF